MPVTSWSTSPSSNNAAPPNGWPEGMAAAAVNDTARQMMADLVVEFQKNQVKVLGSVAGTNTITASMTPALTAYSAGMMIVFTPANSNTGAATLNLNSLGALDVFKADGDALAANDLVAGVPAFLVLDSGADDWYLLNPQTNILTVLTRLNVAADEQMRIGGVASATNPYIAWYHTDATRTAYMQRVSATNTLFIVNDVSAGHIDLTTSGGGQVRTNGTEIGFRGLPQNAQTGNYTLVLADAGKNIYHASGAGAGDTYTIPANASVAYDVGTAVTFINSDSNSVSIAITTDTMTLAGTTTTGTRTLAQNGIATAVKVTSTSWLISGTGLS